MAQQRRTLEWSEGGRYGQVQDNGDRSLSGRQGPVGSESREGGRVLGIGESEGRSSCESKSVKVRIENAGGREARNKVHVHENARDGLVGRGKQERP